jgi:hypothetical protein
MEPMLGVVELPMHGLSLCPCLYNFPSLCNRNSPLHLGHAPLNFLLSDGIIGLYDGDEMGNGTGILETETVEVAVVVNPDSLVEE